MAALVRALLVVCGIALAGQVPAQIVLFEHDDFAGRRVTIQEPEPDLNRPQLDFGERASSASVRSGTWQVCSEAGYRGRCVTLSPGDYRSFGSMGMNDRAVSVRPVGRAAGPPPQPPAVPSQGASGRPRIVLFDETALNGRSVVLEGDTPNFEYIRFNDRAASAIIESGTWLLCEHEEYRGRCLRFQPGQHLDLQELNQLVSSARVVDAGGRPVESPSRAAAAHGVVLYSQRGLAGRALALDRPVVRNLEQLGFNDRAASVRIEQGYWLMCSDADFDGECRTFGPGDYLSLPPGLENRVSSVRRISDYYPYRERPSWR